MASNYEQLVEALRYCKVDYCSSCLGCPMYADYDGSGCLNEMHDDAADAIERFVSLYEKAEMDATNLTGKLAQAEADIERLKEANEELREKQTYIDHYGDRWMTSAKDVPTSAYEHGYADGWDEAMAKMEVQDA